MLEKVPDKSHGNTIMKILDKRYKDLSIWRYRQDPVRLIYSLDHKITTVKLLDFEHRGKNYDQLDKMGYTKDTPAYLLTDSSLSEKYLENKPSSEEIIAAIKKEGDSENPIVGKPEISRDELVKLEIPSKYHEEILKCKTEDDQFKLMGGKVPYKWLEKLFDKNEKETNIFEKLESKKHVVSLSKLEKILKGESDIRDLMVSLDENQNNFVKRFSKDTGTNLKNKKDGAWLIKGPAGSGKTVVLLNCAQSLIENIQMNIKGEFENSRILFTSFTNALVNSSKFCLDSSNIQSITVDSLKEKIIRDDLKERYGHDWKENEKNLISASDLPEFEEILKVSLSNLPPDRQSNFQESELDFLYEEVVQVIMGRGLKEKKDYLKSDSRKGRGDSGRRLSEEKKKSVWAFHLELKRELKTRGINLWNPDRFTLATEIIKKKGKEITYDFVFVDEAQDLSPVAIEFLFALARNSNIVIATDSNQKIFRRGFTSSAIPRVKKTVTLRKSYRCSREIWEAAVPILENNLDKDNDTAGLSDEPTKKGPVPEFCIFNHEYNRVADSDKTWTLENAKSDLEMKKIYDFITKRMMKENLSIKNAVVITRTPAYGKALAKKMLAFEPYSNLRPKWFKSKYFNLNYDGLKITNPYSAKGLEFPIVVIAGFEHFPYFEQEDSIHPDDLNETIQKEKNMFYVSVTRAIRHLLVLCNPGTERYNSYLQTINGVKRVFDSPDLNDWSDAYKKCSDNNKIMSNSSRDRLFYLFGTDVVKSDFWEIVPFCSLDREDFNYIDISKAKKQSKDNDMPQEVPIGSPPEV
tara:strand:- start:59 stop:2473 length:2415 start_codon:yes stop_codon:yes gene_type:complete